MLSPFSSKRMAVCNILSRIHKAVGKQLNYLRRNIAYIHSLLDFHPEFPLKGKDLKYLYVIQTIYNQQEEMHRKLTSSKWAKMTKSSQDTALRDINDLVDKGVLQKEAGGGRSTNYELRD